MKKVFNLIANLSLKTASFSVNSGCGIIAYEPKMPASAKRLIKD